MIIKIRTAYPLKGMTKITSHSGDYTMVYGSFGKHTLEKCVMHLLQDMYPDTFTFDSNFPTMQEIESHLGDVIELIFE